MEHETFGAIITDTNPGLTPFGFAGGLYTPESPYVRFGARDYDPIAGRWLSKDPIRFNGGDANLYGYVLQDPVNFIDPTGKYAQYGIVAVVVCGAVLYVVADQYMQSLATKECIRKGEETEVVSCERAAEERSLLGNILKVYAE